jgi:hypothetical protein
VPTVDGWTALSLSFSLRDDDRYGDDDVAYSEFFRSDTVEVSSFLVPSKIISRWKAAADEEFSIPHHVDYSGYLYMGEWGNPSAESLLLEHDSKPEILGTLVEPAVFGASSHFEHDATGEELRLDRPSESLLRAIGARWNGGREWHDAAGEVVARYVIEPQIKGLVMRSDALKAAVNATNQGLAWMMLAERNTKQEAFSGYHDLHRLLITRKDRPIEIRSASSRKVHLEGDEE